MNFVQLLGGALFFAFPATMICQAIAAYRGWIAHPLILRRQTVWGAIGSLYGLAFFIVGGVLPI